MDLLIKIFWVVWGVCAVGFIVFANAMAWA